MATFTNAGGSQDGVVGTTASHDHNGVVGRNTDASPRNSLKPEGHGVLGTTHVPDGAGVCGLHESGGVGVAGFGHPQGIGVVGVSAPQGAKGGDGVLGITNSEHRNGLVGRNDSATARGTLEPGGNGVFGFTQVPDGSGIFGMHAGLGVGVGGLGLIGVWGGTPNGVGVMGVSLPPGGAGAGDGVQGITNSAQRNGIYGLNQSTGERGSSDPVGNGVLGYTNVPDGSGVLGAHGRGGHGLIGQGGFGVTGIGNVMGVWGIAKQSGWAGYFSGPTRTEGKAWHADADFTGDVTMHRDLSVAYDLSVKRDIAVDGDVRVRGDVELTDKDIAERFAIEAGATCGPGTVMVIGQGGALTPCASRYDRRVVGVVAGAGTLRSAITLGATDDDRPNASIALVGTACCQVDADLAPVQAGDLITTSETPGHGMRADDATKSRGAILGKALGSLASGRGLVPIVLTLQ